MPGFWVVNGVIGPSVYFDYRDKYYFKFSSTEPAVFGSGNALNWASEWIKISDLTGAELIIDSVPVSKFKRAALGTLVFGALGTVAGLVSGATAKPRVKVQVALQLNNVKVASFVTKCTDFATAYRLLNTLAQMEKEYYEEHPELKIESKEKESQGNVFSDEITKLKQMLDDGIIDQEEFKEMKKVLIDNSKQ